MSDMQDAKRTIRLNGRYRLRRYDALNWTLQRWREPDPSSARAKHAGPRWYDTGRYFQTLGAAVGWAMEDSLRSGERDQSLAEAVAEMRAFYDEAEEALRGACGRDRDGGMDDVREA